MNGRPVLLLPGRVDAALAAWLIVGRTLFSGLVGSAEPAMTRTASLTRKVTSTIGIVDVVLVRNSGDGVEPVASGFWPMQAIAQVDGWISVPAQSEGYDAGARIDVGMLP
jgi:molybdopterin biosynthesis enzyme